MLYEIYLLIKGFTNRIKKDNVSAFSAQSAFFLIMSIVPFLSLLLTLVKFLPVNQSLVLNTTAKIVPTPFKPLTTTIINELFEKSNGAILSLSALLAVWSAAKGVLAIIRGLHSVYHIEDKRNYFILRFFSAIYTVIFVSAILFTLLLVVFSNQIYLAVKKEHPVTAELLSVFIHQRFVLTFCILSLFFIFVYKLVPKKNTSILNLLPGAILSAISWIAFSSAFSIYIDRFSNFSYTYGSLATIVILMLWVYICMYILFIGAEINIYFKIYFEMLAKYFHNKHKQLLK